MFFKFIFFYSQEHSLFVIHSSKSSDKCTELYIHYQNHDREQLHCPKNVPLCRPFAVKPSFYPHVKGFDIKNGPRT